MSTYQIYYSCLEHVKEKLAKVNKRYKNAFDMVHIGEPYRLDVSIPNYHQTQAPLYRWFVDITLSGTYKPDGAYSLVAAIEPELAGNVILHIDTSIEVPLEYRTANNVCDHCHKNRKRNKYYLFKALDTGKFLQVGSSCMHDFLPQGAGDVINMANYTHAVVTVLDEDFGEGGGGRGWDMGYDIESTLEVALGIIENYGYISKKVANENDKTSTADEVAYYIKHGAGDKYAPKCTLPPKGTAVKVLEWLYEQDESNQYFYNLRVLVSSGGGWLASRHLPLLVSLAGSWQRYLAQQAAKGAIAHELVDIEDGARKEVQGVIMSIKSYDSDFGTTYKMLVQCEGFRVFGTIPSSIGSANVGDTVRFTAKLEAKEKGFGFYSRPTKAEIVALATE